MCLIGIAYQHLPGTPLLLLANRDEYYARPARPIDRWEDARIFWADAMDKPAAVGWR